MDAATQPAPEPLPSPNGGGGVEVTTTATVTSPAEPGTVGKVIIAVHGIGDQYSFATIQSVVNQFCVYYKQPAGVPLGNFHGGQAAYSIPEPYPREPFARLAFAEVYWAPIARNVQNEKYTLEEAKKWARTIVERLRLRWWTEGERGGCTEKDFHLTQQVLGEMIQTIAVVDRLCFVADKAGLFTFDLKTLLDNYLGDVQIVAEFKKQREEILQAFAKLLDGVEKAFPNAEIYLVTHSEGTVVTLLGLLQAFRQPDPPRWSENVRGLMTLGSPIDKHLALWPELFGEGPPARSPQRKIEWRNYYDFGDPVGFKLDDMREWIAANRWQGVFNFDDSHDVGFTRYPFPGKAHVEYWTDKDLFGHFISTVVEAEPAGRPQGAKPREVKPKPGDLMGKQLLSYILPYVGVAALLFVAAFVVYKAVTGATGFTGFPDPITKAVPEKLEHGFLAVQVAGLAALLLGITAVARIPRLTRSKLWRGLSCAVAVLGAVAYMGSVRGAGSSKVGDLTIPAGGITLGVAIVVVVLVYLISVFRPSWGLTPLMVIGTAGAAGMVASHLRNVDPERDLGPLWPVVLATVGFLYLWWLAALLFDLVFIWHLYIRHSRLMARVDEVLGTYKERAPLAMPATSATSATSRPGRTVAASQ